MLQGEWEHLGDYDLIWWQPTATRPPADITYRVHSHFLKYIKARRPVIRIC
jgi:hypothetical protein